MKIETSRFGRIEVDESRVVTFSKGLLGFSGRRRYVLIQPDGDGYFFWLQSVEAADLAFVVTDPNLFVPEYRVPLRAEQMGEMGLGSLSEAQVLVIVNKRGSVLTGNLQGPLVIHMERKVGEQLVLTDRRFHTRMPLVDLGTPLKVAMA